jgi:preprotein translocase subunit SecA
MWASWAEELGILADETSRDHILALADAGMLSEVYFHKQAYLRAMARGFKLQQPPPLDDLRAEYRRSYEVLQESIKREAQERERRRSQRRQEARPQTEPKIGRNAPCPCGSGKKYKKCHGRPGGG